MLSGFFVTKKGKNLLAKTHDGAHIKLTRAEIGNGDLPDGQLISDVSSLYGKIKDLGLNEVKMISGNTACVPVLFTNKGIHTSFELKEIGIFALDPDEGEILYLYGNTSATGDKPDEIKSESEAPLEYLFNLNLSFEDGTEVEVDVNNGILYVTKQELIDMADTKVDKVAGKGLSTEDYTTADKSKLAGIAAGANKYVHPSSHPMSMITGLDSALDGKVDKVNGKGLSTEDYSTAEKSKLAGIEAGANRYVHPDSHPSSMITGLSSALDGKVDKVDGKGLSAEDYTTAEKTKLAGIAAGANKYVHPSTHPSTMITGLGTAAAKNTGTTAGNIPLIGSDGLLPTSVLPPLLIVENVLTSTSTVNALSAAQGKVLNDAKVDKVSGKGLSTNDYTTAEKNKLAGIATGANNYTHPASHPASMITGLPSSLPADGGTADKVKNKLSAGSKAFDGSAAVTLTAADLGALTSIPATYVTETEYATASKGGVVKSSTAADKISVGTDGIMSVNTVSGSKVSGAVASATSATNATTAAIANRVANKLTVGSKGFDGSAAVTLTAADLGAITSIPATYVTETEYATTAKGGVVKSSASADKVKVETDGTMSLNTVNANKITGTLAIAKGGTGATTSAQALTNLGVTYGTADLAAGTSALATGAIYLVYE